MHENNFELTDDLLTTFEDTCEDVINHLENMLKDSKINQQGYCDRTNENIKDNEYTYKRSSPGDRNSSDSSSSESSDNEKELTPFQKIGFGALALGAFAIYSWFNE